MGVIDKAVFKAVELGAKSDFGEAACAALQRFAHEIWSVQKEVASASRFLSEGAELRHQAVPGMLPSDLSNSTFSTLLSTGKVTAPFESLPFKGSLEGEFALPASEFHELQTGFSEFLGSFREANLTGKASRRQAFARANAVFDQQLVPKLEQSGISVKRLNTADGSCFKPVADLQLNENFQAKDGTVNLNTVGGMRSFLLASGGDDDMLRYVLRDRLPGGFSDDFLKAPASMSLTAEQRTMMFKQAVQVPFYREMADPALVKALESGAAIKVPAQLHLELPANDISISGRVRSLAYFEETAHLFQFLNQGPLTKMGTAIDAQAASGDTFLHSVADSMHPGAMKIIVLESDLVGVLDEFGIKPPSRFLNWPLQYQRRAILELINHSK